MLRSISAPPYFELTLALAPAGGQDAIHFVPLLPFAPPLVTLQAVTVKKDTVATNVCALVFADGTQFCC